MKTTLILCAIVCFVGTLGQSSNTTSPTDVPTYFPGDNGAIAGLLSSVQLQQFLSQKYGNLLLNFQYAMGWMQVAGGYHEMSVREAKGEAPSLEESDSENDVTKAANLEEEFIPLAGSGSNAVVSYDDLERNTEYTLLHVLKIMYLQAAQKLSNAHQSYYQSKIQLSILQGVAQGNPGVGSVVYMMYYMEVLRVMSSAITIQRQDAWNTWLLLEIMETNQFDNSRGEVPEKFVQSMASAKAIAGQTWYMEAMLDMQIVFLEYYIQMIIAQLSYQAVQTVQQPQQFNSFVETESEAEPSKPFFPSPAGGASAHYYLAQYMYMLKFWAIFMNLYASSSFTMSSQPQTEGHPPVPAYSWVMPLQQWSWIKLMEVMFEMYGLFAMLQGPMMGAAAAAGHHVSGASFVQSEAPVLTEPAAATTNTQ